MRKKWMAGIFFAAACIFTGCSSHTSAKYTTAELDNLAQIEVYSAENDELIKVLDDEDILYRYNQCSLNDLGSEEEQAELEKNTEGANEEYYCISYKYPVSRFGSRELEENTTVTIYEDISIIKMTVSEESINGISVPQEYLTFYYEVSQEDMEFYRSLGGE